MEIIFTITGAIWSVLSFALSILWWIVSYLLWGMIWLLLPLVILAAVAVRMAEKVFGREMVRSWVKARVARFGVGSWERVRPWLFALSAAPFRVLIWLVPYAVWHAIVSIFWTPRWSPWTSAWGKRWKSTDAQQKTSQKSKRGRPPVSKSTAKL